MKNKEPPVKPLERSHTARQFLRFSKYWMNCKDPVKKAEYFRQARILGERLEEEHQNSR